MFSYPATELLCPHTFSPPNLHPRPSSTLPPAPPPPRHMVKARNSQEYASVCFCYTNIYILHLIFRYLAPKVSGLSFIHFFLFKERMNLILRHDPVWLESLPTPDGSTTPTLLLIGGDSRQVEVPAALLLAVSPLVRSILTDLLPPAYCLCFLSLPATGEVLQVVRDLLTSGTVAGDHVDAIEEVRQVLGMLGIEALLVSYQLESIQVGQVFDRNIKEELSSEGSDISLEETKVKVEDAIVKIENQDDTNVEVEEESNTFGQRPHEKNFTPKSSLKLKSPYNSFSTFSCNLCKEKFAIRSLLKRHIESVHKTGISCSFCPQKFTLKQTLRRHIKSEHDKSEFTCYLCSKKFRLKHGLVSHIQYVHDQIKVECHLCPQKFTTKQSLVRHIKSVHDQITIQCNLCPQKFTQKESLKMHIKAVHEQIKIQCDLCPKQFSNKSKLVMHIKSFHYQIKIQCNICQKKLKISSITQHVKSVHGET